MEHSKKINMEYLSANQPEVLGEVHRILREDGISEQAYAKVFCLTFNQIASSEERVSFVQSRSSWQMGNRPMSDAKILVSLSKVCELIHEQVIAEWNDSIFAAWIDSKELERIIAAMDGMESLNKLKAILQAAGKLMAAGDSFVPPATPHSAPPIPPAPAPVSAPAPPQPPAPDGGQSGKKKQAPVIQWDKGKKD